MSAIRPHHPSDWMRPHRIVASQRLEVGETWEVDEENAHHLLRVLRLRQGEPFVMTDGEGREHWLRPVELRRQRFLAEVVAVRDVPLPAHRLHLAFGLLPAGALRFLLEKAVEVGVWAFHPLEVQRSVAEWGREEGERKRERWERIVAQAVAQSRRAWAPRLHPPIPWQEWPQRWGEQGPVLVADPEESTPLEALPPDWKEATEVALWIGPEGGWSPQERESFRQRGWLRITLGPFILRAETAGVVGAALVLHEWGRGRGPRP